MIDVSPAGDGHRADPDPDDPPSAPDAPGPRHTAGAPDADAASEPAAGSDAPAEIPPRTPGMAPAEVQARRRRLARLACDAGLVVMAHDTDGHPLDVGRRTRSVPPALRRALDHRDGGCRFPGCGSRFCDAHHVVPWAEGGETSLANLVLIM